MDFGTASEYPMLRTPRQRGMDSPTSYDTDGDNLIEIATAEQLEVVRYDLDGDGLPAATSTFVAYAAAFPTGDLAATGTRMGCASGCEGYELSGNITLSGAWTPIDGNPDGYAAEFDGNGYTISGLTVPATLRAGLFGQLESGGVIRDLGIMSPTVSGTSRAGGLVAQSDGGEIIASYVQGGTVTITTAFGAGGGLVGWNQGEIKAAYARDVSVDGGGGNNAMFSSAGGLTGHNSTGGHIIASYAAAAAVTNGINLGGLTGLVFSTSSRITASYCDTTTTTACIGNYGGSASAATADAEGHSSAHLKTPTGYTGIYATWNLDLDGDTYPDYLWDFGEATDYPGLYPPTQRQAAAARVVDYDADDDNLIDIGNPHQLNALRYDPDGDGRPNDAANYSAYSGGFPNGNISDTSTPWLGCETGCIGYELTGNLESAADAYPDWTPIASYQATLDGKGFYVAGLAVSGDHANAGLFAVLTGDAVILDLGLKTPSISSSGASANAGALAGDNAGRITASYVEGGSVTVTGATSTVGGLAGRNTGDLRAVWATAAVNASSTGAGNGGGLIGIHSGNGGSLIASYAAGAVTGSATATVGGLIGDASAAVTASYCDTTASTQSDCIGSADPATITAEGKTTAELQSPTGYTGIYQAWAITITPGDDTLYAPWDFGEATDYPKLYGPADRQPFQTDTLPPPLPRSIPPEPERPYDPAADHPEIYENDEYGMTATCQTYNGDPETGNPLAATVNIDLGSYTGPVLLHLSIWANGRYMAYETQGIAVPTLERDGQRATLRVATDPTQTRFRLDGRRNGLAANLVLGYANCHNDES